MSPPRRPLDSIPENADASYRIGALRELQRILRPLQQADLVRRVAEAEDRLQELETWREKHGDGSSKTPKVTLVLPDGHTPALPSAGAPGQHRAMTAAQADGLIGHRELEAVAQGAAADAILADRLARVEEENRELKASGDKWKTYVIVTFVGLLLTAMGGLIVFLAGRAFPSQQQSAPHEDRRGR